MPKITVEIEWDWPDEPEWLNADNVAVALHAHCKNTKFQVRQLTAVIAFDEVKLSNLFVKPSDEALVFTAKKIK